jgi:hypothetical protein
MLPELPLPLDDDHDPSSMKVVLFYASLYLANVFAVVGM